MSVLVPQDEIDKKLEGKLRNLTFLERLSLAINVTKEDFRTAFSRSKKEEKIELDPNMFECRGSVVADIGGIISDEEHEEIRKRAFPKKK